MFATELESLEGLPFSDKKSVHSLILKNHELASMNKKNEIFLKKNELEDEITDFSSPRPNSLENLFTPKEAEYDIVEDDNPNSSLAHFHNNVLSSDVEARNLHQSGGDFSYSQKLFHIADGNLYSIFSPLQGRSYGVKPSFLRKQRCTVQECQGRGRKSLRKGLKFHNFLPSESITSEKDDNHFEDKWKVHSECRLREEHGTKQIMISNWSLCVDQPSSVQESNEKMEHSDFKEKDQNCYSPLNKLSVEMDSASNEVIEFSSLKSDLLNSLKDNRDTFSNSASLTASDVNLAATTLSEDQHLFHETNKPVFKNDPDCSAFSFKKETDNEDYSFLNSMLNSENLGGFQGDFKSETMSSAECESFFKTLTVSNGRKNRRKPTQTRRVVPYTKYLSLIEENESYPLDLSSHAGSNDFPQGLCTAQNITNESEGKLLDSSSIHKRVSNETFSAAEKLQGAETFEQPTDRASANETAIKLFSLQTTNISPNQMLFMNASNKLPITPLQVNAPITYLCPIPMKQNSFSKQSDSYFSQASHPYKIFDPAAVESSSTSATQSKPTITQGNHVFKSLRTAAKVGSTSKSNFSYRGKHNDSTSSVSSSSLEDGSVLKDIMHAKPRRRSQRSVIKQKLEDTFRQNGFLVKTKQVSDGEATFCKFRQLRKYTRYYLKSWQQHLPDEVHKMWKGFLPPKTILPPISGEKKTTI